MKLLSRALLILKMRGEAMLNKVEDPRVVLHYFEEQQQELLRRVKQGLIDISVSRHQLERQVEILRAKVPGLEKQARRSLVAGREDMARLALERKQFTLAELQQLEVRLAEVSQGENKLALTERQLTSKIELFRVQRKAMIARYNAAEAQVRVQEALGGVTDDHFELGRQLERAEDNIEGMLARASAIDELTESGTLEPLAGHGDSVERQLTEITRSEAVNDELSALQAMMDEMSSLGDGESDDDRE